MTTVLIPTAASGLKTFQHIHEITGSGLHYLGVTEAIVPRRARWGFPHRRTWTEIAVIRKDPTTGRHEVERIVTDNNEEFLVADTAL